LFFFSFFKKKKKARTAATLEINSHSDNNATLTSQIPTLLTLYDTSLLLLESLLTPPSMDEDILCDEDRAVVERVIKGVKARVKGVTEKMTKLSLSSSSSSPFSSS